MALNVKKTSTKSIKPSVPTAPTFRQYKLGFTDESAPIMNISIVLFFSVYKDDNPKFVDRLEKSLEKTLTRLYPLAGRYEKETQTINCSDQGAELTLAEVDVKLQDILSSKWNSKLIDQFIPCKPGDVDKVTDPILSIQVTTFAYGGVALGVSAAHRIVDASTLSTVLNEWAAISREENELELTGPGFNSSTLFPARGISPSEVGIPRSISDDMLSKFFAKKLTFSGSAIANMKAQIMLHGKNATHHFSKVQLVSAIIWKAFITVDQALHNRPRRSTLLQIMNLRERTASLIPKNSCGNMYVPFFTVSQDKETAEGLAYLISNTIKQTLNKFSKLDHESKEGQMMVLNSLSATYPPSTEHVISISSWCKFPFYDADFGFGKPVWVTIGSIPIKNSVCLIDDVRDNGVEAYVTMKVEDVPYFEEALDLNAFAP